MSFVYDPASNTTMDADAGSDSAPVTLYQADGTRVEASQFGARSERRSFSLTTAIGAVTTGQPIAIFLNNGDTRTMYIREIQTLIGTVQGALAAQTVMTIDKARYVITPPFNYGLVIGGPLVYGDMPNETDCEPSIANLIYRAAGLLLPTTVVAAAGNVASIAMPDRASAMITHTLRFEDEPLELQTLEALVWRASGTWDAGAGVQTLVLWDETPVEIT